MGWRGWGAPAPRVYGQPRYYDRRPEMRREYRREHF
jgi:hypothetical protein